MRLRNATGRPRRTFIVGCAATLAIVAASCSSDSKSSSSTAAPTTVAAATTADTVSASTSASSEAATTAPADSTADTTAVTDSSTASSTATSTGSADPLGTPNAASGDPFVVGNVNEGGSDSLASQSANVVAGMEIAAKYANDYLGGIGGHPIQVEQCGDKATPAGATDCANQLVEKKVNAYTMPYSAEEAVIIPILATAKVPMLLGSGATSIALTTPGVFDVAGGLPAWFGAFAIQAKEAGVKKLAMITIDVPTATDGAKALGGITFAKEGIDYTVVPVAGNTPDMTPQLQSAISDGADALGVVGNAAFCTGFLQAYQTLALTVPKYLIPLCVDSSVISAVPDALNGSHVAVSRAEGPDDAIYAAATAKYGDGTVDPDPNVSSGVADGWTSMMGIVNAMQGYTGPIDSASVIAQFAAAKNVPIPLSGGLTFSCDGTAIPLFANVCSGGVQMAVVDSTGAFSNFEKIDASEAYAK